MLKVLSITRLLMEEIIRIRNHKWSVSNCQVKYKLTIMGLKAVQILQFLVREKQNPLIQLNLKKICKILTISFNRCATSWTNLLLALHRKINYKAEITLAIKLQSLKHLMVLKDNKWPPIDNLEMVDHFLVIPEEAWELIELGQMKWKALDLEVPTFFNSATTQEIIPNEAQLQHMMATVVCKTLWRHMFGPSQECCLQSFQKWTKKVT